MHMEEQKYILKYTKELRYICSYIEEFKNSDTFVFHIASHIRSQMGVGFGWMDVVTGSVHIFSIQ